MEALDGSGGGGGRVGGRGVAKPVTGWIRGRGFVVCLRLLHYFLFTPQGVEDFEGPDFKLLSELGCLLNSNWDVAYKRRVGGDDMGQAVASSIGFSFLFFYV